MINRKKKYEFNKIYFIFATIAMLWTAFSIFHDITNIPAHHFNIKPGSPVEKFESSSNIGYYVKNYTTFFYFTMQSNIIFSIITMVRAFYRGKYFTNNVQIASTTYMIITSFIFWTALSFFMPWSDILFDFEQIFLHLINPILSLILIIYFLNHNEKDLNKLWIRIAKMLSYPMIYYVFLWIFYLAVSGNVAVYPFSNFYKPFLYDGNIFIIIMIDLSLFITFTLAVITVYYGLYKLANINLNKLK